MQEVYQDSTRHREVLTGSECGFPDLGEFGRHHSRQSHSPLDEHVHTGMLEICYLAQGSQIFAIAEKKFQMQGGDIFFTLPDELHGTCGKPVERNLLYWLMISEKGLTSILNLSRSESTTLWKGFQHVTDRVVAGGPGFRQRLDQLMTNMKSARSITQSRIRFRADLALLLIDVLEAYEFKHQTGRLTVEIEALLQWIGNHLHEDLRIPLLAERVGLSASRFKVRFREETGLNPGDYVMRKRIDKAKELLHLNKRSITDIAYELGYSSSQYFSTVFRRYEGISPSEYRQKATSIHPPRMRR